MKNLNFSANQCVKVTSKEEYNSICHHLRSGKPIENELLKPLYFTKAVHITKGVTIGHQSEPINVWTRQPLIVLSYEDATK